MSDAPDHSPEPMKGKRVEWPEQGLLAPGEYSKAPDGTFYAMTPNDNLAWLKLHAVTEHEDGAITVYPSILVSSPGRAFAWHGFLERGVWRQTS